VVNILNQVEMKMDKSVKSSARNGFNSLLGMVDLELIRKTKYYSDYRDYIPLKETIEAASKAGMSVGDYIDFRHNVPGSTQNTIDKLKDLGVFQTEINRVCEIGPGSGRYLEKILAICKPDYY
jgi:hypothetical protein